MGCFVAGLGTQAPGFAALVWPCAACQSWHADTDAGCYGEADCRRGVFVWVAAPVRARGESVPDGHGGLETVCFCSTRLEDATPTSLPVSSGLTLLNSCGDGVARGQTRNAVHVPRITVAMASGHRAAPSWLLDGGTAPADKIAVYGPMYDVDDVQLADARSAHTQAQRPSKTLFPSLSTLEHA
jgi:hypothetical protein